VIEAAVTIVLIGVFLLVAGFGALMVRRLFRATVPRGEDG
jgi:nitrate reductase gamma subunit